MRAHLEAIERKLGHRRLSDSGPFRFGDLKLSEDKIALVRFDQPETSVRRSAITGVRVKNGSLSEHPLREFLWGTGLFIGGRLFARA